REGLEQALRHQESAYQLNPQNVAYRQNLGNMHRRLAFILVLMGEHSLAVKSAARLPQLFPDRWQELCQAADRLCECAALADRDILLSQMQRSELAGVRPVLGWIFSSACWPRPGWVVRSAAWRRAGRPPPRPAPSCRAYHAMGKTHPRKRRTP